MQNTLVIWDWDNTLADTRLSVQKGLDETMLHFGFDKVTEDDIINVMTRHRGEFWQSKFPLKTNEGEVTLPEAIEFYVASYRKYSDSTKLFIDALPVLTDLKNKGVAQAILSNKNHDALVQEVQDKGVFDIFTSVQGTTGPLGKPELLFAEPLLKKVNPQKIIFIGDGQSDMLMAKNLGATAILVHHRDESLEFDYYFDTLKEVGNLLNLLLK